MIGISLVNIGYCRGDVEISDRNRPVVVTVEGHSAKGIKGSDPLCAAVSVLSQTMILALEATEGIKQTVKQSDGYLKTEMILQGIGETRIKRVEVILEFFITGIAELARIEPEEITVMLSN